MPRHLTAHRPSHQPASWSDQDPRRHPIDAAAGGPMPKLDEKRDLVKAATMDVELNAWLLYSHLRTVFGDTEVVSQGIDGTRHVTTYGEVDGRAHQLMHALDRLGID